MSKTLLNNALVEGGAFTGAPTQKFNDLMKKYFGQDLGRGELMTLMRQVAKRIYKGDMMNTFKKGTFDATVTSSGINETYAYVYSGDSSRSIYLTPSFWNNVPTTGASNFASYITLHELSHFAGTDDFAYGAVDVSRLAKQGASNIGIHSNAIQNADSFARFIGSF
jgi:hypothetical protein